MCGIAGILRVRDNTVSASTLEAMNSAQRHRGPDDWGAVLLATDGSSAPAAWSPNIPAPSGAHDLGLGHVRLSILDLGVGGHQPMSSSDQTVWLTYNGEVYNYLELRIELQGLGFAFHSNCDTEVVLAAYQAWGLEAFRRFNGMWALALWDSSKRVLVCARDRLGVKPFHYFLSSGTFAFSSEIQALLTLPEAPRRPDDESVARFLAWAEMPSPERTFFSGIQQLPPGHLLLMNEGRPSIQRWWSVPTEARQESRSRIVEEVRDLLLDSVRLRMRSDVPLGVCLSGGLDSSAITCLMRDLGEQQGHPTKAFTCRFQDPGYDESEYARQVVEASRAVWSVREPSSQVLRDGDLRALIRTQGEPFASLSIYAQYSVFRQMREAGVTVALDGQGADELFWGYTWHYAYFLRHLARAGAPLRFLQELFSIVRNGNIPSRARLLIFLIYYAFPEIRYLRGFALHRRALTLRCRSLARVPRDYGASSSDLSALRRTEVFFDPLPSLLRFEDRNSMAFSIESRLPFLDYRLVERILSVSGDALIRDGWTKSFLREAMVGILPEAIRMRRTKLGFSAPTSRLLSEIGPLVKDAFLDHPRTAPYVNPQAVLAKLQEAKSLPSWVTRAIITEFWMREFNLEAGTFDRAH